MSWVWFVAEPWVFTVACAASAIGAVIGFVAALYRAHRDRQIEALDETAARSA
jgi:hypothetical protein